MADGAFATRSKHCGDLVWESDSVPVALVVGLTGSGQWFRLQLLREVSPWYRGVVG